MQLPFLNRWHPVLALRYLPVVDYIHPSESVLEIGSGSLGIGPYLKRQFTGLDLDFSGPAWPLMTQIKADTLTIPKPNKSFDVVVSMDVLEHLPPNKRYQAISEMFRVAKKKVIIGVPLGQPSHLQDKKLHQLYLKVHGRSHPFLKEQTEFGLPTKKDIISFIKRTRRHQSVNQYQINIIPNLNLNLRFWLMKGWISDNLFVNIFFRKILLLVIPVLRLLNHPPVYRQIFIVKIK